MKALSLIAALAFAGTASAAGTQPLVRANNQFTVDLLKDAQRRAGDGKNVFLSPLSVATAFGMVLGGAGGGTAAELSSALHLTASGGQSPLSGYGPLLAALNREAVKAEGERAFELEIANRIWGQKSFAFEPAYVALTRDTFGAELQRANFVENAESERAGINAWVDAKTHGKIPDLFSAGTITADTRLALANAIYFKGKWDNAFEPALSADGAFAASSGAVAAPFMNRQGHYAYAAVPDDGVTLVELPYKGGEVSMIVALPDAGVALEAVVGALGPDTLARWSELVSPATVSVSLPKFKLSAETELPAALAALGAERVFTPGAELDGISRGAGLFVSAAIHKAYIEVNEEGTEAAAGTGIGVGTTSIELPETFVADRPFLFYIFDRKTGSVLFTGTIADPTAAD